MCMHLCILYLANDRVYMYLFTTDISNLVMNKHFYVACPLLLYIGTSMVQITTGIWLAEIMVPSTRGILLKINIHHGKYVILNGQHVIR